MEKLQTPLVAGVGGAAVLAALLSFGGSEAKKPAAPQTAPAASQSGNDDAVKGTSPNQEGPWRAICEEYSPNGVYDRDPAKKQRGYTVSMVPADSPAGSVDLTLKPDRYGHTHKIAVHKQLVGDLVSCIPKSQLSGVHLIVATVPDPDKTEMRLEFDRYVEALERGAAIRGFHYSGYWFPWSPRQTGPPPHKEDEVEAALLRAEQPGVLIFHNDNLERLIIFVVGETPTSGINRTQMVQALLYRKELLKALGCDHQKKVVKNPQDKKAVTACGDSEPATDPHAPPFEVERITLAARLQGPLMISGPHFSGTLSSLREVLQESNFLVPATVSTPAKDSKPATKSEPATKSTPTTINKPTTGINPAKDSKPTTKSKPTVDSELAIDSPSWVDIISPDISSGTLIDKFNCVCNAQALCSFRSLSITGAKKDTVAVRYLNSLGYENEHIAKLIEDESGVSDAESVLRASADADSSSAANASSTPGAEPNSCPKNPDSKPNSDEVNLLKLTYPRELSAVRSLSDLQSEQLAASGSRLLSLSRNLVDIKLAGQEPVERDRPSTYASESEAAEITSALDDDVRMLQEKNIQCIVVSATNPLDRIFLLEYIHERLPNIRMVAEDGDELIISHPHYADLTGTIVISSLPTVPAFASTKNSGPIYVSFRGVAAEGQFLSVAILLDHEVMKRNIAKLDDDVQDEALNADIREKGWPVSIAGENGFVLVHPDQQLPHPNDPLSSSPPPKTKADSIVIFGHVDQDPKPDPTKPKTKYGGAALEVFARERAPKVFIVFSLAVFLLTVVHLVMSLNSESARFRRWWTGHLGKALRDDAFVPKLAYLQRPKDKNRAVARAYNLLALNSQMLLLNLTLLIANPMPIVIRRLLRVLISWIVKAMRIVFHALPGNPMRIFYQGLPENKIQWSSIQRAIQGLPSFAEGRSWLGFIAVVASLMVVAAAVMVVVAAFDMLEALKADKSGPPEVTSSPDTAISPKNSRSVLPGNVWLELLPFIFFLLLMAGYLFSSACFLVPWQEAAFAEWRRILNIDDGLSPIVPIAAVLLAWALWGWLQLRRVKWTANRKINLLLLKPKFEFPDGSLQRRVCDDTIAVHDRIEQATIGMGSVLFVLLFSALGAWWEWSSLKGLERYEPWQWGPSVVSQADRLL